VARFVAFLRAINSTGHYVTMADLRQPFERLGLARVETFLQSGNVVFEAAEREGQVLEEAIEEQLEHTLGYPVATFVRSTEDVRALVGFVPSTVAEWSNGTTLSVIFLRETPSATSLDAVQALTSPIDRLCVFNRHLFWLCQRGEGKTTFSAAKVERVLGSPVTLRSLTTLQKLAAKHFAGMPPAAKRVGTAHHGSVEIPNGLQRMSA